jgi:hypothetical protein
MANKWVQDYVKKKLDLTEKHKINTPSNLNAKQTDNRFIEFYG